MEHNTINNMKKALLIVCLFISVIASGQGNFFWSHNSSGGYGLLYNWYAATSTDKITSSDDWVVPSSAQFNTLATHLGGTSIAGGKMKTIGFTYWLSPNTGATNESGFNGKGAGGRQSNGAFIELNAFDRMWTTDTYTPVSTTYGRVWQLVYNNQEFITPGGSEFKEGRPIRIVYVGIGTPTQYTGNDGYVYKIVLIGTQYWIAQNLRETKMA